MYVDNILEDIELYHDYNIEVYDLIEESKEYEKELSQKEIRKKEDPSIQNRLDCPYCGAIGSIEKQIVIIDDLAHITNECSCCHKNIIL